MGEVWRGRDAKLRRDVALKVLPDLFASDPERLARFRREAQLLASLNHANIAAIYGLEEAGGVSALVLEYVEGPTLAERIAKGPIPIDEALPIAAQVAEALEAAHQQGVIHRDLKPANVKVRPDGTVKVLDFGLAKAVATEPGASEPMSSPTISLAATHAGIILGTAAYMAPEQAKGKAVDRGADVWAFGCVLYEMLTGRRAFQGEDLSETLAGVLKSEPLWDALPPDTPVSIRRLLRRCLSKDRRNRISDMGVARLEIADAEIDEGETSAGVKTPRGPIWRRALPILVTAAVTAVVAGAAARRLASPPGPAGIVRFAVPLPPTEALPQTFPTRPGPILALSPDGSTLVYVATRDGIDRLYRRPLDDLAAAALPGTEGARYPFFSPDGKWLGFHADRRLKKVPLAGGPAVVICDLPDLFLGASWGSDNNIVFSAEDPAAVSSVPAAGGVPRQIMKQEPDEAALRWPVVLPGAGAIVITSFQAEGSAPRVLAYSLDTGERRILVEGTHARYAETGHLLFSRDTTIWAAPFDVARLEVTGDPAPLLEDVNVRGGGNSDFSVAGNGTVAYLPGYGSYTQRTMVWVDREGREEPIPAPPRAYVYPRISPDGTRLAVQINDQEYDIWVWDFARANLSRLTFDRGVDQFPAWSPDGLRIAYSSLREGVFSRLFWQAWDGSGGEEQLGESASAGVPMSFSPDGQRLILRRAGDLHVARLDGEPRFAPLIETSHNEQNGEISPDGRWIAYQSGESGGQEIYVRPFPHVEQGRWQVSVGGGSRPLWSRDGREIFYVPISHRQLMSVPVSSVGSVFTPGVPRPLPVGGPQYMLYSMGTFPGRTYDVSPDGRRFLMFKLAGAVEDGPPVTGFVVILNWFDELRRLAPRVGAEPH
jgi:serine/threonine-protein kinase